MSRLINIGYGNVMNVDKIVSVVSPDSAPIKRMVQAAKDAGTAVDATQGRKTKGRDCHRQRRAGAVRPPAGDHCQPL